MGVAPELVCELGEFDAEGEAGDHEGEGEELEGCVDPWWKLVRFDLILAWNQIKGSVWNGGNLICSLGKGKERKREHDREWRWDGMGSRRCLQGLTGMRMRREPRGKRSTTTRPMIMPWASLYVFILLSEVPISWLELSLSPSEPGVEVEDAAGADAVPVPFVEDPESKNGFESEETPALVRSSVNCR